VRARLLTASLLLLAASTARGQTVEITPVVGYRFGGSFTAGTSTGPQGDFANYEIEDAASFGVHLGFRVARDGEIEVLYSRQNTRLSTGGLFTGTPVLDLALESWHAGGNYLFAEEDARVRPYIGMGLGFTRLLPGPGDSTDETRFSASFAAGAKVWLGRHVGFRFEGRGFYTFLGGSHQSSCQTGQGCQVHAEGSEISQGDATVGLILRF
jgi:outer membrane protein with beta-barrel domain